MLTALGMSGANIVGYVRCKSDARAKLSGIASDMVASRLGGGFAGKALQSAAGSAFGF